MKNLKSVQPRFWKRRSWKFSQDSKGEESHEPTSSDKEMDLNLPTAQDTPDQNDEDLVCPRNSGLKFPFERIAHSFVFDPSDLLWQEEKEGKFYQIEWARTKDWGKQGLWLPFVLDYSIFA